MLLTNIDNAHYLIKYDQSRGVPKRKKDLPTCPSEILKNLFCVTITPILTSSMLCLRSEIEETIFLKKLCTVAGGEFKEKAL